MTKIVQDRVAPNIAKKTWYERRERKIKHIYRPIHTQNTDSDPRRPMQGLFVPFACIGSGDPVGVLCLLHNEYTGCS